MIELGISQAQSQFTKILNQEVTILDKKNKIRKAVILPYEVYSRLIQKALQKEDYLEGEFSEFSGLLSKEFTSTDERYNDIINEGQKS
ncbi:MAG TPA: type II toxin-antitoxin system Phd/YefM family antitoxin [Campylobacterales bacterium]|nr:type II toxin-antitoxin system Phd/YefM family antitoxin [Campylobacterales bacterium]